MPGAGEMPSKQPVKKKLSEQTCVTFWPEPGGHGVLHALIDSLGRVRSGLPRKFDPSAAYQEARV